MKKNIISKTNVTLLFCLFFISFSHAQKDITKIKGTDNSYLNTQKELKRIDSIMLEKSRQYNFGNPKTPNSFGVKKGICWQFEYGNVYYNYKTEKTYAISTPFLNKWAEIGWENGWLGFPTSDEINSNNNSTVNFENGSILYSDYTNFHFLGGAFRDFWLKNNTTLSTKLGFPKTDEVVINEKGYTRYQQFEFGTLFWGPDKDVLYFPEPNKILPYNKLKLKLNSIKINSYASSDEIMDTEKVLELYGFMDISVFNENGQEIKNVKNTSNSFFNNNKDNWIRVYEDGTRNDFSVSLDDRIWQYDITSLDIENGYIRITYNFNDKDFYSSDDYLQLQGENGRWNYRNGNYKYRDIKLKEIFNQGTTNKTDLLKETSQYINVLYSFKIVDPTK